MLDSPPHLGRTLQVGAAPGNFIPGSSTARSGGSALGTPFGKLKNLFTSGALVQHDAHHLGNDFSSLLDGDGVTKAHIEPANLILVVESSAFDGGARQKHRFQFSYRSECAGASDLHRNILQFGFGLFRLIFISDGPTRG